MLSYTPKISILICVNFLHSSLYYCKINSIGGYIIQKKNIKILYNVMVDLKKKKKELIPLVY